jgi:hypothetical protein
MKRLLLVAVAAVMGIVACGGGTADEAAPARKLLLVLLGLQSLHILRSAQKL